MKEWLNLNYPNVAWIMQQMRYELYASAVHLMSKWSPRRRWFLRQLQNQSGLKINVCSGSAIVPGWLNVDILPRAHIRMDFRRPFPLRDGSVALLFHEHYFDHVHYPIEIARILAECHRILAPGARARFCLLDGRALMEAVIKRDAEFFREGSDNRLPTLMAQANYLLRGNRWRHFLYDYETFERLLKEAGFSEVKFSKYCQSECPELILDFRAPHRERVTMYMEAVK